MNSTFEQTLQAELQKRLIEEQLRLEMEKRSAGISSAFVAGVAVDFYSRIPRGSYATPSARATCSARATSSPRAAAEFHTEEVPATPLLCRSELDVHSRAELEAVESFMNRRMPDHFSRGELRALLKSALKHSHPDTGSPRATTHFQRIFTAYRILNVL